MNTLRKAMPETRAQLERVMAVARRMVRGWWMVALFAIAGGAIALGIGVLSGRKYMSETVIMYREIIPSKLLQGPNAVSGDRNMAERLGDMASSSTLLSGVIERQGILQDVIEDRGHAAAVEEMRKRLRFRSKGGGTFHLSFLGTTRAEAQAVTKDMADSIIRQELDFRKRGVEATRKFIDGELDRAEQNLHDRELEIAAFLAKHPEFAEEATAGLQASAGASIRARTKKGNDTLRDPREEALRHQRDRIRARLAGQRAPAAVSAPSPEVIDARQQVSQVRKEVRDLQRDVEAARLKYTDQHPDVTSARSRLAHAKRRLKRAEEKLAAEIKVDEARRAPATPENREALQAQLHKVEAALAQETKKGGKKVDNPVEDAVVELETEWARLTRNIEEARDRLGAIQAKAFTAEIVSASELGGQGAQLEVLDPASWPTRPAGLPRRIMALAGFVALGGLGAALVLIRALADDRILSVGDLNRSGLDEPIAVVPKKKRWGHG